MMDVMEMNNDVYTMGLMQVKNILPLCLIKHRNPQNSDFFYLPLPSYNNIIIKYLLISK
jgi:hypothetical protein